jgi:hypothetical protein
MAAGFREVKSMNRNTWISALGAAIGGVIGAAISDIAHLTHYWPELVVALGAAGGVFVGRLFSERK